jgi:hypothetical protein
LRNWKTLLLISQTESKDTFFGLLSWPFQRT